jgi:uncharacterized protein YsxB (DUF464 family)
MIKVKVKKNNNKIEYISITGHAMYDDFGKDIVCSSVSSIVITTVNAIERINGSSIVYEEMPFSIKVVEEDEIVSKLIDNMISLLKELEKQYPKNIRFLEEE